MRNWSVLLLFWVLQAARAQDVTFPAISGAPGSSVPVAVKSSRHDLAAFQFDVTYDPALFQLVAVTGDGIRRGSKQLFVASPDSGTQRYLVAGRDATLLDGNDLFSLFVNIRPTAPPGNYTLHLKGISGANAGGDGLN